ncbi:MAG TPA: DMT family protein [Tepidisphaeraceae bacterium]|nr:DMT family protein [Tepidisphaeraceae bacterium]
MTAAILLLISNIFMTFAWYGHLKYKSTPIWIAVLASWGIAFFEYCFQVPANRIGHGQFTATQLKIMQEGITLVVFVVFAKLYFAGEPIKWNYIVGMALIFSAAFIVFYEWK